MASAAFVSVSSVAGEVILPTTQIHDNDDLHVLIKEVRAAASARHVTLVSKTGQALVDTLSARDNSIVDGDNLTAVFVKHDILWLLPLRSKYVVRYDITDGTLCGIEHGVKPRGHRPFGGAVCLENKTYFMPVDSDAMLIYDNITTKVARVDVTGYAQGVGKFIACFAANGKIHFVPGCSNQLLVYDVACSEFTGVDIRHVADGQRKWHSALLHGDSIIALPSSAKAILVYNIVTGVVGSIPVCPRSVAHVYAGEHAFVRDGGKFYVLPNEHKKMLIYDCDSQAVSVVDVDDVDQNRGWAGGTVVDGRLFALPIHAGYIWRYDLVFQTSSRIDISVFEGGWGKMVSIDGVIYCAPCASDLILEYNTKTGGIASIDASYFTNGRLRVFMDIVVVKGKLYFVPCDTNSILVCDKANECISAIDASGFSTRHATNNWGLGVHVVEQ